jgi:hypothetical protein
MSGTEIVGEIPITEPDGTETVFQVGQMYVPGSLRVWIDGIFIAPENYSEIPDAAMFELFWAPDADERITVSYTAA